MAAESQPPATALHVTVRVTNTGDRAGADVVQLYGHDPVASVTRPVAQLLGYQRVQPRARRASAVVELTVPPARLAFTAPRRRTRIVEPGDAGAVGRRVVRRPRGRGRS